MTSHISSGSKQGPMGLPGLGGLFAGGMPTLKKSSGIATGALDNASEDHSRRESTDWFGRLASNTPVETAISQSEPTMSSAPLVIPEVNPSSTAAIPPIQSQETTHAQSYTPVDALEKSKDPIESKVDFSNGHRAKALWSYSAMAPDQINFEAGSYLQVYPSKEADNVDWVYGELEQDGLVKGWLPKAYTEQVSGKFNVHAPAILL